MKRVLVCIHDYWMIGNKLEDERELFSGMEPFKHYN